MMGFQSSPIDLMMLQRCWNGWISAISSETPKQILNSPQSSGNSGKNKKKHLLRPPQLPIMRWTEKHLAQPVLGGTTVRRWHTRNSGDIKATNREKTSNVHGQKTHRQNGFFELTGGPDKENCFGCNFPVWTVLGYNFSSLLLCTDFFFSVKKWH